MDMLCIAASHDPIGYIAVAGRGLEETDIARMTGGTESEVHVLLGELDRNGVFSRDRKGTIYSRRMVADAKKAAIAKKNGKEGGNPTLCNSDINSASVKGSVKPRDKPHKPYSTFQENEEGASALPDWLPLEAWNEFLEMRKRNRASLTPRAKQLAIAALSKLRDQGQEPQLVLEQSTMNGWRGLFPLKASAAAQSNLTVVKFEPTDMQGWRDRVRVFKNMNLWHPKNGPKPGETGCRVPDEILAEFKLVTEAAA